MLKIPYGEVRTYGTLAERLKAGARAVGTACGRNPIPVIIPLPPGGRRRRRPGRIFGPVMAGTDTKVSRCCALEG